MKIVSKGKGKAEAFLNDREVLPFAKIWKDSSGDWLYVLACGGWKVGQAARTRDDAAKKALAQRNAEYRPSAAWLTVPAHTETFEGKSYSFKAETPMVYAYGDTPGEARQRAESMIDARKTNAHASQRDRFVSATYLEVRDAERLECGCLPYGKGCYTCRYEFYMST